MTMDPAERGRLLTRQFAVTALAEATLMGAVLVLHYLSPLDGGGVLLLGVLLAIGLVVAVYAIYRAVRLAEEPTLRAAALLTVGLVIAGPLLLWAVLQTQ